jgi:drug/metabolite transporter (DMT)-like permease
VPRDAPSVVSVVILVVAALLFACVAAFTKAATGRLPGSQIALVRALVGLIACAGVATRRRFVAHNWWGLFLRGVLGGGAVLCYFVAIAHLPVGIATLLTYTSPVFTTLWAAIFLREAVGPRTIGALLCTTLGVALVIEGKATPGSLGFGRWELVGIASAILSGAAIATIREVRKTDGAWEIFAAFCVGSALLTLPTALGGWVTPSPREWAILAGVGIAALAAQLLMTYALRYVRASLAGVISQLTPVASLVLGWLLYDERAHGMAIIGAAVTLVGITWGAMLAATPQPVTEES